MQHTIKWCVCEENYLTFRFLLVEMLVVDSVLGPADTTSLPWLDLENY